MNAPPENRPTRENETGHCLARSVADTLAEEPALEAVTIDRAHQKISLATLGRADVNRLTERITNQFETAQAVSAERHCSLLTGQSDCATCDTPLSEAERKKIVIRTEGDATTIARATCPTAPKFWRWRDIPLPRVVPRDVEFLEHAGEIDEWKPQLAAAILCGVFGLAGAFSPAPFKIICYVAACLAGGFYPAEEVWERLQKRTIDVHFLMLFVAAGAASIGAWGEGATLLFLFSFSGALEHYALGRTQKEIRSLFRDAPKTATALDELGREREVKVEQIKTGMRLLIKPGAQFPVDAEIAKGSTAADESNLTGEATPVEKKIGDTALAGTINLWGAVEVTVTRPAAESALQKIITLIKEAQQQKAPAQQFTDKFSTFYTYFVIGLSFAMFFVWWLGFRLAPFTSAVEEHSAFYRTMTLLVVSSPCALVLSIPSAVLAAIAWGARHGILFRGGAAVEKLAEVNTVCLDKTGTLTTGELRVEKIESFPPGRENEIARLAFSLERLSTHPLARAITRHGKQQKIAPIEFEHFESVTGQGLKAKWNGVECRLGGRDWFERGAHADVLARVPATDCRIFRSLDRGGRFAGPRDFARRHPPAIASGCGGIAPRRIAQRGFDRRPQGRRRTFARGIETGRRARRIEAGTKGRGHPGIEQTGKTRRDDRRRRERRAESGGGAHRRGDGRARFGRRAGAGRRGADARPAGKFSRGIPVEPARAAHHPAESCSFRSARSWCW